MRKNIFYSLLLIVFAMPILIKGQTTIKFQGFEGTANDTWSYTVNPATFNSNGDVWAVVDNSFHSFTTIPSEGSKFWGVEDLNSPNGTTDWGTITFSSVDISSYSNVVLSFDYEVDGYDTGDDIKYEAFFNGTGQGEVLLVDGASNLNQDGTVSINIPDGTSNVYIVVSVKQNGTDYGGFDNFKIIGEVSGGVVNPSNFSASAGGSDNIDLSWDKNSSGDNVMVAYNTTNTFGTPSDGSTYTAGSTITGGGTVIYNGANVSYNHSGLTSNTTYYYKAWSVDGSNNYSSGVVTNATTAKEEPSNHVTGFAALAAGSSQINLNWTENDGIVAPDGYLIKASTADNITAPTDGTDESDDTDLSDGSGAVNMSHGTTSYSWTGLTASTTYYFKIYPYTNSGSHIDYKTDGTVPSANATTGEAPKGATDLIISEYVEGSANNKYIEIYNGTGADVDLTNYEVRLYANGASSASNTENLSGTLADGSTLVLANSSATIYSGTVINSSVCNFNGDDAIAIYNTNTNKYVDIFGVIGDDPGSAWTSGSYSTANKTLRRKSNVAVGVRTNPSGTGAGAFTTLESEWDLYDQDNVDNLGSHTFIPVPAGSYTASVALGDNSYTFTGTSVRINFIGVTTASNVTVNKYNNPPAHISGISESNISEYRWVIDGGTISFGGATEIRFKASELEGISNSSTATIVLYKRSEEGSGSFTSFGTMTYDAVNDEFWVNIPSFSEVVLASNDSPLPVELKSFTASVKGNNVALNWATATEVNNYGFQVERKKEMGESDWEDIGFVQGHGNSNSVKYYSYIDNPFEKGSYSYRLKQIDLDGAFKYSDIVSVDLGSITKFALKQNYPNPFNPTTEISFDIPKESRVKLSVYNALGQKVADLLNEKLSAGTHRIRFDGSNLTSGIYFYKMQSAGFTAIRKMILMK